MNDTNITPAMKRIAEEWIEKCDPEAWKVCYPRIYTRTPTCGQYYSPKIAAHQFAAVALKVREGYMGQAEQYEFLVASQLARYQMPTFWLSEPIAQAVLKTVPPQEIEWYDMPLPFEGMIFMLPKGAIVHPTEGDVAFVCFARFKAGERHISKLVPGTPFGSINGGMTMLALTVQGHLMHWNLPVDSYGKTISLPDMDDLAAQYGTANYHHHHSGVPFLEKLEMTPEDNKLVIQVAHIIFGSILLMLHRPDLVTHGGRLKTSSKKGKDGHKREFWEPNVIGAHYWIRQEAGPTSTGTGTHASPRMHWVRGAYKEQPYGPKRTLRKTMWIEPYLRGATT